ncbi:MAG: WYL domain-containing protein [Acidobacteria bacterium]|nr:WYL domain-containing protein [Acidobacteriota bacterium]
MSHRGDLTERLITILILLAERPHSQQELAQRFGVDGVTIRRNLMELTRHFMIVDDKVGRERVYRFSDNYEFHPPNLTPGELATLLLAQQAIGATGLTAFGTPFGRFGYSLLDKVRAALPKALRAKLDALATIFGSAAVPAKDYSTHTETIDRLTNAAMSQCRIRMRYRTLHSGETKDRLFDPYAVYFDPDGATLKVIGFDHSPHRQTIIPLSIDHIESLTETAETFTRPPDFNLQQFLTDNCFNGIHGEPLTVQLKAHGTTARVFAERRFHPSQRELARTTDAAGNVETITIEMTVARGRGLERFILSWLPDVEVLEPSELRQKITEVLLQATGCFAPPQ